MSRKVDRIEDHPHTSPAVLTTAAFWAMYDAEENLTEAALRYGRGHTDSKSSEALFLAAEALARATVAREIEIKAFVPLAQRTPHAYERTESSGAVNPKACRVCSANPDAKCHLDHDDARYAAAVNAMDALAGKPTP